MTDIAPHYSLISPVLHTLQMSSMIAVGQQPGVPFRVGDQGAQRPDRPTKKAQITDNLGSICKNSFSMIISDDGIFSLSFKYDSIVPLSLSIYFGAKDSQSVKEIRCVKLLGNT
jgi:hypothetical protein